MRILQVMASCSRSSGVAQVMMNYYRHISDQVVFDFLLFWREEDSFEEEIRELGGNVFYTGKPSISTVIDYIRRIKDFFHNNIGVYDAVHLHELYINSIIFPIAKRNGIKVRIAHSHTTKYSEKKSNALRNWLLCLPINYNATSYFACSTDAGITLFGKRIVNKQKLYVVNNAIDCSKYIYSEKSRDAIRREFDLADDFVVGHVGRFSPVKNHKYLIRTFMKVVEEKPRSKLLLIGEGALKGQIKSLVNENNLQNNVVFIGQRKDIGDFLSAMDCFVLPSLFEGLGIVLIEAQCNGLPCVASSEVPGEARILSNYETVSLDSGYNTWAAKIIQSNGREINAYEKVTNAGFNIFVESPRLVEKYKNLIEGY